MKLLCSAISMQLREEKALECQDFFEVCLYSVVIDCLWAERLLAEVPALRALLRAGAAVGADTAARRSGQRR